MFYCGQVSCIPCHCCYREAIGDVDLDRVVWSVLTLTYSGQLKLMINGEALYIICGKIHQFLKAVAKLIQELPQNTLKLAQKNICTH